MKSTLEVCFCGIAVREHANCRACGILIGPGHVEHYGEKDKKSGRLICGSCSWYETHPPPEPPELVEDATHNHLVRLLTASP